MAVISAFADDVTFTPREFSWVNATTLSATKNGVTLSITSSDGASITTRVEEIKFGASAGSITFSAGSNAARIAFNTNKGSFAFMNTVPWKFDVIVDEGKGKIVFNGSQCHTINSITVTAGQLTPNVTLNSCGFATYSSTCVILPCRQKV